MWVEIPRGSELSLCLCKLTKQTEIQVSDGQNGSLRLQNAKTVLLIQVRASQQKKFKEERVYFRSRSCEDNRAAGARGTICVASTVREQREMDAHLSFPVFSSVLTAAMT